MSTLPSVKNLESKVALVVKNVMDILSADEVFSYVETQHVAKIIYPHTVGDTSTRYSDKEWKEAELVAELATDKLTKLIYNR